MKDKWIYAGMFLDRNERSKLLRNVSKYIPDEGWIIYATHSTIVFHTQDDENNTYYKWSLEHEGEKRTLTATHIGISDKAIAVRVDGMFTKNDIPHITVAVSTDGTPYQSNQIKEWIPLEDPFKISTTVGIIGKK